MGVGAEGFGAAANCHRVVELSSLDGVVKTTLSALGQSVFAFWTFEGYLGTRLRGSYPS